MHGSDSGTNYGSASDALPEPKASLIFTPVDTTEFYLSYGTGFHSDDLRGVDQARIEGVPGAPLIARQTGEEVGMRQEALDGKIAATVAFYRLHAQSETTYDPDIGQDIAGPGSIRQGYEINMTYQVLRWLEIYASYSGDHARFTTPLDDGTGHLGYNLPNAPLATGSLNIYLKNLGPWSGGLAYRYLSSYPLSSGPCNNAAVAMIFRASPPAPRRPLRPARSMARVTGNGMPMSTMLLRTAGARASGSTICCIRRPMRWSTGTSTACPGSRPMASPIFTSTRSNRSRCA